LYKIGIRLLDLEIHIHAPVISSVLASKKSSLNTFK